jgi:hypothetical protein
MSDNFVAFGSSPATPSENAYPVTPNDSAALPLVPKYLYVGQAGNVALRTRDAASDVVFENVPAGGYLFVRATHVRQAGTTAAAIVACA